MNDGFPSKLIQIFSIQNKERLQRESKSVSREYVSLDNVLNEQKQTLLHYFAQKSTCKYPHFLIEHFFTTNHVDFNGNTPLHYCQTPEMMHALYVKGCDHTVLNNSALDAPHFWILNNKSKIFSLFISLRPSYFKRNFNNILDFIIENDKYEILKIFCESFIDVNPQIKLIYRTPSNTNPLLKIAEYQRRKMIKFLKPKFDIALIHKIILDALKIKDFNSECPNFEDFISICPCFDETDIPPESSNILLQKFKHIPDIKNPSLLDLYFALKQKDFTKFRQIMSINKSLKMSDKYHNKNMLMYAAKCQPSIFQWALQNSPVDLLFENINGKTAIGIACAADNGEANFMYINSQKLLTKDSPINQPVLDGKTLLAIAFEKDYCEKSIEALKLLGATLHEYGIPVETSPIGACILNPKMHLLREMCAIILYESDYLFAIRCLHDEEMIRAVFNNFSPRHLTSTFEQVFRYSNEDFLNFLITQESINVFKSINEYGVTILHCMAKYSKMEKFIVPILIRTFENSPSFIYGKESNNSDTFIHCAIRSHNMEFLHSFFDFYNEEKAKVQNQNEITIVSQIDRAMQTCNQENLNVVEFALYESLDIFPIDQLPVFTESPSYELFKSFLLRMRMPEIFSPITKPKAQIQNLEPRRMPLIMYCASTLEDEEDFIELLQIFSEFDFDVGMVDEMGVNIFDALITWKNWSKALGRMGEIGFVVTYQKSRSNEDFYSGLMTFADIEYQYPLSFYYGWKEVCGMLLFNDFPTVDLSTLPKLTNGNTIDQILSEEQNILRSCKHIHPETFDLIRQSICFLQSSYRILKSRALKLTFDVRFSDVFEEFPKYIDCISVFNDELTENLKGMDNQNASGALSTVIGNINQKMTMHRISCMENFIKLYTNLKDDTEYSLDNFQPLIDDFRKSISIMKQIDSRLDYLMWAGKSRVMMGKLKVVRKPWVDPFESHRINPEFYFFGKFKIFERGNLSIDKLGGIIISEDRVFFGNVPPFNDQTPKILFEVTAVVPRKDVAFSVDQTEEKVMRNIKVEDDEGHMVSKGVWVNVMRYCSYVNISFGKSKLRLSSRIPKPKEKPKFGKTDSEMDGEKLSCYFVQHVIN